MMQPLPTSPNATREVVSRTPAARCVDAGEDVIVAGVNRDIPDVRGGHILEPCARRGIDDAE